MKGEHASDTYRNWNSINWDLVERKVSILQARIVKAKKNGKHRKVKSLQWMLNNSFYAKLLAVKRVTSNKGKNTPGIDGVIWKYPAQKYKAALSLTKKGYKASPLRRVYIPKANGKKRPLGIPTMKDRAMQALHLLALQPIAETTADVNSYGFRPYRCCADAIEQCFIVFARKGTAQWVLEADIKGCFDNISHQWLLDNIPMDKQILRKWLKAGVIEKNFFSHTEAGTPQGGIISPVLANLTLDGLEKYIDDACGVKRTNGNKNYRGTRLKVNFIRYADDFVISAADKSTLQDIVLPAVEKFLSERGLTLQLEKTRITHITAGFDFLGQNVRKYNGKLLIKPSRKSITNIKRKLSKIIQKSGNMPTNVLIFQLNPIIRGWANYHRHVVSKFVFSRIDHDLFQMLWLWAIRRHNTKNRHWIRKKYFVTVGNRQWAFAAKYKDRVVPLEKMEHVAIKRHLKIRGGANPFDKDWHAYFVSRNKSSRVRT